MAWNSLNNPDNGHSVGLAYLSDINPITYVAGEGIDITGDTISTNLTAGTNITFVPDGNNIRINAVGGGGGGITEVVAGLGIGVDDADPERPIVNNTGVVSVSATNGSGIALGVKSVDGDLPISINLIQGDGITLTPAVDNTGITISAVPPVETGVVAITIDNGSASKTGTVDLAGGNGIALTTGGGNGYGISNTGVLSLSDGATPLTGAITLIGSGCSIGASSDPSPAITISVPVPPPSGVVSLNGVSGAMNLISGGTITFTPNVGANTLSLDATPAVAGVVSISDGTNVATGAVVLEAGEGIEILYDAPTNKYTLSSDPFVGIYNLLTAQNLTATGTPWINNVINMTPDPQTDVAVVSYDPATGVWTILKDGVYFLNFSAGIIQNDAKWTFGSFCQCFIVITSGATQYNFCNSLTPSDNSGVGTFNGQVFGYIPLSVGTTITCGFQWYLQTVGSPVAQFQPRTNGINNGTNFNWVYVRPFL